MKKLFAFLAVFGMLSMGALTTYAQDETQTADETTAQVADETQAADATQVADEAPAEGAPVGIHKQIKTKFIEGGAMFMSFVLLALIFGLAICIERSSI
jgi:biopolymer transport protein ExbB